MAGCATGRPPTFADRFVARGTPAIDLGGTPPPARPVPPPPGPRPPTPARTPRADVAATTLESVSPLLRMRLAALAAHPTPSAFIDVAAAYRAYGVDDRAFDYLERGLTAFPRDSSLHDALARHWRDWGFPDRALRHAHLAVWYAPDSAPALTTLGTVLWALTDREEAAHAFHDAFERAPDAGYTRYNWCVARRDLGRPAPECEASR